MLTYNDTQKYETEFFKDNYNLYYCYYNLNMKLNIVNTSDIHFLKRKKMSLQIYHNMQKKTKNVKVNLVCPSLSSSKDCFILRKTMA